MTYSSYLSEEENKKMASLQLQLETSASTEETKKIITAMTILQEKVKVRQSTQRTSEIESE